MVNILSVKDYKFGLINTIEEDSIPRGASSDSLNWMTKGDHIELRRGFEFLGTNSVNSGVGKATGIKKATTSVGVEILFGTYGKKFKYYDETTEEWIENGSDLLGSAVVDANGLGLEPISMSEYTSLAGSQMFLNSPNCAGYYKVMIANPGSSVNMYDASKNFKGLIKVDNNRTLLHLREADQTGLYGSYIDSQTYTLVTAEAIGSSGSLTYSGTLGAISSVRSVFAVTFTDTSETFSDNYDGTLTGSAGGTGTINYATGAYSVTFAVAAVGSVTATYQWENSNTNGITDFTKSGTRTAGQGFIFRQDDGGGPLQAIAGFNGDYYGLHLKKTWVLTLTATDTAATNLPYREKVGIPNPRASISTGEGIYYIDDTDQTDVRFRLLTYDVRGSNQVIPVSISRNITLNNYRFDQAAAFEWGDYILFACATSDSTQQINGSTVSVNNRTITYNRIWKAWDVLDYAITCMDNYNGTLVAGDALSNNFMTLFSGFSDDNGVIVNHWIGNLDDFSTDGSKKVKKFYLRGLIAVSQKLKVSISIDGAPFVEIGGEDTTDVDGNALHLYAIQGDQTYVDRGNAVTIGSQVLGSGMIGGGSSNSVNVYNYERLFSLAIDNLERVKIRYEAVDVGYVSVSQQRWHDWRYKGRKIPAKYRG